MVQLRSVTFRHFGKRSILESLFPAFVTVNFLNTSNGLCSIHLDL